MTPEMVMTIGQRALEITILLSAPLLLAALIIGLLVGVFQAATQINEMTLSFIPKLISMAGTLVVAGFASSARAAAACSTSTSATITRTMTGCYRARTPARQRQLGRPVSAS